MPEQKITYAERFLKEHREALRDTRTHSEARYIAKRTIAKQSKAIRETLMWAYEGDGTCQSLESQSNAIDNYLLEHGYIEPAIEYCTCTEERTVVCDDDGDYCMCWECGKQYIEPKAEEYGK